MYLVLWIDPSVECHAVMTYKSWSDTNGHPSFIIYTLTPSTCVHHSLNWHSPEKQRWFVTHSQKGKGKRKEEGWESEMRVKEGGGGEREREAICMKEYFGASTHTQVTHRAIRQERHEWMHVKSNVYIRSRFILIMQLIKSRKQESTSEYVFG